MQKSARELLLEKQAKWHKAIAPARTECDKLQLPALIAYNKAIEASKVKHRKDLNELEARFELARRELAAEHYKTDKAAWTKYNKINIEAQAKFDKARALVRAELNKA